jgi:hypothetical protein
MKYSCRLSVFVSHVLAWLRLGFGFVRTLLGLFQDGARRCGPS